VVNATLRPLYSRKRPGTQCTGGWLGPRPVCMGAENLASTGIRSPDRPACSKSLYRAIPAPSPMLLPRIMLTAEVPAAIPTETWVLVDCFATTDCLRLSLPSGLPIRKRKSYWSHRCMYTGKRKSGLMLVVYPVVCILRLFNCALLMYTKRLFDK